MIIFVVDQTLYSFFQDYITSITLKASDKFGMLTSSEEKNWEQIKQDPTNKYIILTTPFIYKTLHPIQQKTLWEGSVAIFSYQNFFILNTEQLSKPIERTRIHNLEKRFRIIDYSLGNISYLTSGNYLPYQVNTKEIFNFDKTKDVCFVGLLSGSYRLKILNDLQNKGIDLTIIKKGKSTELWSDERDQILFRHKILINIHYQNTYNIHEQLRTNRCIFNKMIVVSEISEDDSKLFLKDHMILVNYENLSSTVEDVLKNYQYYYDKLFNNLDYQAIDQHYQEHLEKITHIL